MTPDPANFSYPFNEAKAAQAAACLVDLAQGNMTRLRVIKLLYLADRTAILQMRWPIAGGTYFSMEHGPVLSEVYDLIRDQRESEGPWQALIQSDGPRGIRRLGKTDFEDLSESDLSTLRAVHFEQAGKSDWELRNFTHDLPEYEDPGRSALPIPVRRILLEEGVSIEEIRRLGEEVIEQSWHRENVVRPRS
ncbi:MAG: SocA family protein [Planctomycetes bacterium]|nr:SocA family protein [Planctomycetota bacterium]